MVLFHALCWANTLWQNLNLAVSLSQEYEKNGLSNLSKRCHEANVVVKPVQGTAILWYNHHINPSTGSMGTMDEYSLHGGCDVTKGVKWIANNWLNAPFMHS